MVVVKRMEIKIIKANYLDKKQSTEITDLLDAYAADPMGGGTPLKKDVKENVVKELAKLPHAFSVLAYVNNSAAGVINCFEAFSTFSCKPLVNIHDIFVRNEFRRHGLSQKMLEKVEAIAKEKDCCKLTLEVLSKNIAAQSSYQKFGFESYELDPETGKALFWQKLL